MNQKYLSFCLFYHKKCENAKNLAFFEDFFEKNIFLYNSPVFSIYIFHLCKRESSRKIIGVVIDVEFSGGYVPAIYDALEVQGAPTKLILEVQY